MAGQRGWEKFRSFVLHVASAFGEARQYIRPSRLILWTTGALIFLVLFGGYFLVRDSKESMAAKEWWAFAASAVLGIVSIVISLVLSKGRSHEEVINQVAMFATAARGLGLKSLDPLWKHPPSSYVGRMKRGFDFMGLGGGKFLREVFRIGSDSRAVLARVNQPSDVRILLVDPRSAALLPLADGATSEDGLLNSIAKDINETLQFLAEPQNASLKFEVRLMRELPPLRIHIVDGQLASVTGYYANRSGWHSPQLLFDQSEEADFCLVQSYMQIFDFYWKNSIPASLNRYTESMTASTGATVECGMVHGRFQPFHQEHLEYVLRAARRCRKRCYVGITNPKGGDPFQQNSSHRHEPHANPFTYDERAEMVKSSIRLAAPDLADRVECVPFEVTNQVTWAETIPPGTVQFVRLFGEWERKKANSFREHGLKVVVLDEGKPKLMEGSEVRLLIRAGRNWQQLVPPGTMDVINRRIKSGKPI
jgi:nicotinamide mononucleotide adenylyltransferase